MLTICIHSLQDEVQKTSLMITDLIIRKWAFYKQTMRNFIHILFNHFLFFILIRKNHV